MTQISGRKRRHLHLRKRVKGTTQRPRLGIYRSLTNLYVHLVDDLKNKTLFALSTRSPLFREKMNYGGNVKAAAILGELFAQEATRKGFSKVVFDRGGYVYHGRIKAFAEAAGKKGIEF